MAKATDKTKLTESDVAEMLANIPRLAPKTNTRKHWLAVLAAMRSASTPARASSTRSRAPAAQELTEQERERFKATCKHAADDAAARAAVRRELPEFVHWLNAQPSRRAFVQEKQWLGVIKSTFPRMRPKARKGVFLV